MCYSNTPRYLVDSASTDSSSIDDNAIEISSASTFDHNNDPYLSEESSYSDLDSSYEDDDTDNEDVYDYIHQADYEQFYMEKEDGGHYLGLVHSTDQCIMMSNTVSAQVFFLNPYSTIVRYLYLYGLVRIHEPRIDIMQLHISAQDVYSVVLKTHWIRLIQRHWRKISAIRRTVLLRRSSPAYRRHNETTGHYPDDACYMPGLHGLLSQYANNHTNV